MYQRYTACVYLVNLRSSPRVEITVIVIIHYVMLLGVSFSFHLAAGFFRGR